MFRRWKAFLARHLAPAEESRAYRVAVTVLVLYALVLTLHQLEWPGFSWAVLLLTPLASWLSYRRRHSPNLEIKIFLSFAMLALLLWFFQRLVSSLFDPRIPLAELLIWLQTLHAFDLPAKKDLRYTVLVALILMALSAVLTYSSAFAFFVLIFCGLFLLVAALDFWSDNRQPGTLEVHSAASPSDQVTLDGRWLGRTLAFTLPSALLVAAVIFVFMPRWQGLTLRTMPFNWDFALNLSRISEGQIVNPAGQSAASASGGRPQRIDGDSYFGFGAEVNLNARGQLSDRLMLKVRTSHWQYHRAVTFAEYTGSGWRSGLGDPTLATTSEPPFYFPRVEPGTPDRLTIYYAESDLPNVIFTPSYPRTLYFPSAELYRIDSLRRSSRTVMNSPAVLVSPFALEAGLVYSTLNRLPSLPPSELKQIAALPPGHRDWQLLQPYLQLPSTLPPRVGELAREIVGERSRPWEQATALCTYLQSRYRYRLDVPFYPAEADTVDHFLFEAREGYCEQFASALCVMARSVGLPARYVTGYLPGDFNPLSGFYEVRAHHAHAWVEILLPNYGWLIFDPVPGGPPNPPEGGRHPDRFLLESLLSYLGISERARAFLPGAIRWSLVLALAALAWSFRRRRPQNTAPARSQLHPYLLRAEALAGPRQPGETVRQWAQRLGREPLERLASVYERTFYRDLPPQPEDYRALEQVLRDLKAGSPDTEP